VQRTDFVSKAKTALLALRAELAHGRAIFSSEQTPKKKPQENPTACELTAENFSAGAQAPSQQ